MVPTRLAALFYSIGGLATIARLPLFFYCYYYFPAGTLSAQDIELVNELLRVEVVCIIMYILK